MKISHLRARGRTHFRSLAQDRKTRFKAILHDPNGAAMATLWGDPSSTSYGALLRVPAGFESPIHTHSSGERIVQITGSSIHWEPGQSRDDAPVLQAGDYFSMAANRPHVSATMAEESIELIIQDGPFNFQLRQPK